MDFIVEKYSYVFGHKNASNFITYLTIFVRSIQNNLEIFLSLEIRKKRDKKMVNRLKIIILLSSNIKVIFWFCNFVFSKGVCVTNKIFVSPTNRYVVF